MATVTKPIALDESLNTTEQTPRNVADVLAQELARIAGRQASDVNYDNTDSGLTADNVQNAIDELKSDIPTVNDGTLTIQQNGETKGTFTANQSGNSTVNIETPTTDIQTAVDEFETYNGGLLSECKVALSPNQDLHGYDSPWVGGAGKNKCDWKVTPTSDALSIALSPNTYTISAQSTLANGNWYFRFTDNNNNYITDTSVTGLTSFSVAGSGWMYGGNSSQVVTFIIPSNCILLEVGKLNSDGTIPAQIEIGSTATVYEPYSNICPISGHTQVDVGDDGKNLFDWTNRPSFVGFIDTNSQTFRLNPNYICTYITCKPNTTYTISKEAGKTFRIATSAQIPADGVSYIGTSANHTGTSITYTTESNAKYLVVLYWSSANGDAKTADELAQTIQIELGSTATPYVPYNGYQVTVNLGGTYYSGTLDVVTGVFVPDMVEKDVSASDLLNQYLDTTNNQYLAGIDANAKIPATINTVGNVKCNELTAKAQSSLFNEVGDAICILTDGKLRVTFSGVTTFADMQTWVTNHPLQVVYELANPTPIQLSPTMVKALVGENHLSAPLEGQEITESKYKQAFTFDDVNAQIESTYSEGISHNSVYRGKYLGDHVTDEQWDAIGDGSFRDLYIGDYWTINGINWRIAHFNYWLGTGDVKCNTNHVVIVPYGWVSTFNMNASDDTTGGYLNSEWYTTNRHFAVENIEADFGASHILSHRNFFSDAVSDGHASHGMWVDSTVDLMNEIMVCGSLVGSYSGKYYEVGCDKFQLALFKYNPPSARMDVSYWLRGVSTASSFVAMGNFGLLDGFTASQILKIRPVFAIKK